MSTRLLQNDKKLIALYNADTGIWDQIERLSKKGLQYEAKAKETRKMGRKLIRKVQRSSEYKRILKELNKT